MPSSSNPPGAVPDFATPSVVLVSVGEAAADTLAALATAELRLRGRIGFQEAAAARDSWAADILLIDGGGAPDMLLEQVLAEAGAAAGDRAVIALIGPEQIDLAAMQLLGSPAQLLCAPGAVELAGALALARVASAARGVGGRVRAPGFDMSREAEAARLQRLNEEVARIAAVLARLADKAAAEAPAEVRGPALDYRGAPPDPEVIRPAEIRAAIRARRLREQFFAEALFADPAWDMLLDLFAAHLERREVSVSSLCIAAAVPPTTALRWIGTMLEAGLFERRADPHDRRRAHIALTGRAVEAMQAYAAATKRSGLGLA